MEQQKFATIFNNVMGPIGFGPSTSNTCGPCRVAYLSRKLLRGKLEKVVIRFSAHSGYSTLNCKGMRSDYAFAHGLLGNLPDSGAPLLTAFDELKRQGIDMELRIDESIDDGGEHLYSVLDLCSAEGDRVEVHGISKGGGIIEIVGIDGFPVSLGGETNCLVVFADADSKEKLDALAESIFESFPAYREYSYTAVHKEASGLIVVSKHEAIKQEEIDAAEKLEGVKKVCALPSLLPVVIQPSPCLPFTDANGLSKYCAESGKDLFQAALDYEAAISGWDEGKIKAFAQTVIDAMRKSINEGLKPGLSFSGIVEASAAKLMEKYKKAKLINDGLVTKAALYSLAIMEYSNSSGVVVCMPTAGASGTVAGILLAAAEQLSCSDEQVVDALMTAGVVGVSITKDNDFCGGVYGCQAEVGCASCMAAAALARLLGGSTEEILNAASMALQNMLGLICDPVCGLVQVPCFARNMSGIANAVVSANMCILGYDPMIPLQDTFEIMKDSGSYLPLKLRGCGGGLCESAKGLELQKQYIKSLN